jgi:hypothetical protein
MFDNKDFYPTPKKVIRKMIQPWIGKNKFDDENEIRMQNMCILEPSAGKGDILDYICESLTTYHGRCMVDKGNLYCIERDVELKMILQSKEYKVIADDFLNYSGDYHFDLIIMNPPFSNGDQHLLKAWDVLKNGDIVCLLNSETLRNPYTRTRQLLKKVIEDNNGTVEEIGSVFQDAERKTSVEVSIVRLKKVTVGELDFEFHNVTKEKSVNLDESTVRNEVARKDVIGNMIAQYDELKRRFIDYMKAKEALDFYSQGLLVTNSYNVKSLETILEENNKGTFKQRYNNFCDEMKQNIWALVLDKINIQKFMTYAVRQNFEKFSKTQGHMDFTKENVESLIEMIYENGNTILDKAIIDVFDMFTRYYDENRLHVEGWKTNDKWKVNKKIILPNFVAGGYNGMYDVSSNRWNEYADIDKVMCYITATNFDDMQIRHEYGVPKHEVKYDILGLQAAIQRTPYGDSSRQESHFFYFRCYKKQTLHIEFKDHFLWQEFNMRAVAGKKWLPEAEEREWRESQQNRPNIKALL